MDAEWRSRCIGGHRRSLRQENLLARDEIGLRVWLSVITDETTQDFGHTLEVASEEFGRGLWNKNIVALDEKEVAEARKFQPGGPKIEISAESGFVFVD